MSTRAICCLTALLLLVPLVRAQEKEAPEETPAPEIREDYRLVVGDTIEVTVIGQEEYSLSFQVPTGGRKRYPAIGYVDLKDRKVVDVEEEIQRKFAEMKILVDPQISVVVISYATRRVYLTGAVYSFIDLPVHEPMRLLQVIAMAGGWGTGDKRNVRIIRKRDDGTLYAIPINAQEILDREAWEKNIKVMPEDMIYIPPQVSREEQKWVYVLGNVRTPAPIPLMRGREPITLMRLVSIVGGFDEYARTGSIRIIRKMEGRSRIITVDFDEILDGERDDVVLEADDVVYVPESIF